VKPVEAFTLVPLGTLVVIFGLFPGLVIDLVQGSVHNALDAVASAHPVDLASLAFWR
jgi:NADH:ubiquinone oxidoreductase subunit 4 (subunit M)